MTIVGNIEFYKAIVYTVYVHVGYTDTRLGS